MLHDRCDLALQTAREGFERTVAVLREENSTLRRMLEASHGRADALLTELTRSVVVSGATAPVAAPAPPRRTSKEPIEGVGNLLEPVPFGDPAGMFTDERAASLMLADDDGPDGVSHAA